MLPNKVGEIKLSRPNSFLLPTQIEDILLFLVVLTVTSNCNPIFHNSNIINTLEKKSAVQMLKKKYSKGLKFRRNSHHWRVLWWEVQCPMGQNLTNTHMTHVILFTEVLVCPQLSSLSCMCRAARRSAVLHFISTANRSCSTSPTLWKHTHSSP